MGLLWKRMPMAVVIPLILLGIGAGVGIGVYRGEMKRAFRRIFPARGARSLPAVLKEGEAVFNRTCGAGYCHGPQGSGGGAPRLAGRGLDQVYIANAVMGGVPGTAMPGFAPDLSGPELTAVVAYVASLNGIATVASSPIAGPLPVKRELTAEAARGRYLFSDALRSFGRCSTCHAVNGIGIPVTKPIANIPAGAAALRALATPNVGTAALDGESMPALLESKAGREVTFYDLTQPPPVLRTADSDSVRVAAGSAWKHSSVTASYSDSELESILMYLRSVLNP